MAALDDEISRLYDERGLPGVRPRFAMPLIRLARRGPLAIRQRADTFALTNAAMSQAVECGCLEGLGRAVAAEADGRTRVVELTERARAVVPFLEAEWRATEQAGIEL